ncbi:MAG: hypothetical protein R2769_08025 [Saprospiraceae bacterium]
MVVVLHQDQTLVTNGQHPMVEFWLDQLMEIWLLQVLAGDYTLTVTMVTNGKTCTISETTKANDANVPPAPTSLAGPLMVCEGDASQLIQ